MKTLSTIVFNNNSGLNSKKYTIWVAGFMADAADGKKFMILGSDGNFAAAQKVSTAAFINVNKGLTINVPDVTNSGNNRLVFTVTDNTTTPVKPADYPLDGYTAYPFNNAPGKGFAPPGPYDIFEFGPNAEYDVSAVDSFGLNLSFTVDSGKTVYGVKTSVSRAQIQKAFTDFMANEKHNGAAFAKLLYTSPATTGYPPVINGQFSAIVSPKDWLAIYTDDKDWEGYWKDTIDAFFTSGNQLNFYLNGATVGNYSGTSDGTKYTLTGPGGITVLIPKSDFDGHQPFIQAVRGMQAQANGTAAITSGAVTGIKVTSGGANYSLPPTVTIAPPAKGGVTATAVAVVENGVVTSVNITHGGSNYDEAPAVTFSVETPAEYAAFGQVEAAIFESLSRGVALDGVVKSSDTIKQNYSSDAWTNTKNWYSGNPNAYNGKHAVYDAYAKFFHTAQVNKTTIFGENTSGDYAMAYGFSLDENPNVGSTTLGIPTNAWPDSMNVPAKTPGNVGSGQTVTLTLGPWDTSTPPPNGHK